MQLLEVSGPVRHIYIYVIRRLRVKECKNHLSISFMASRDVGGSNGTKVHATFSENEQA